MATLTVSETVHFSTLLRARTVDGDRLRGAQAAARTIRALRDVGIVSIAGRRVGSMARGGISGGERRRVAIACELVCEPRILLLDEPTSGLDSYNAKRIVTTLRHLAHGRGCMVIMTIHGPRAEVFALLDRITLMHGGRIVCSGSADECRRHFAMSGVFCPPSVSFADFIVDRLHSSSPGAASLLVNHAMDGHPPHADSRPSSFSSPPSSSFPNDDDGRTLELTGASSMHPRRCPTMCCATFTWRVWVLSARATLHHTRSPGLFASHFLLAVALGVALGLCFARTALDLAGAINRAGLLLITVVLFCFTALSALDTFIRDRYAMEREVAAGYYGHGAAFAVKAIYDLIPLRVVPAAVYALVVAPMAGLRAEPGRLLVWVIAALLVNATAAAVAMTVSTLSGSVPRATLFGSVFMLFNVLFSGILLNLDTAPPAVSWLQYASFTSFGYVHLP